MFKLQNMVGQVPNLAPQQAHQPNKGVDFEAFTEDVVEAED